MAYLNRTITLRFDGESTLDGVEDDKGKPYLLPLLGDDVWVTIRNPMLMPQSMLMPQTDIEVRPDGQPVSRAAAIQAGAAVVAGLVVAWSLNDVLDMADDPTVLPMPATAEMLSNQVPSAVCDAIAALIGRARNPR